MRKRRALLKVIIVVCAAAVLCSSAYFLMNARGFQLAGKIVTHADTDRKLIALTFDDGPSKYTDEILGILDELGVRCTFFLTGESIEQNMEATKAIVGAGHQIGNHSYSHQRMVFKSAEWIASEIDCTNALIREAGYEGEIYFRPPNCKKLLLSPLALAQRDMTTITWSVEVSDNGSSDEIADLVIRKAQPGAIVLLHIMYNENEREAIPRIIHSLQKQGYEFVTVEELLSAY